MGKKGGFLKTHFDCKVWIYLKGRRSFSDAGLLVSSYVGKAKSHNRLLRQILSKLRSSIRHNISYLILYYIRFILIKMGKKGASGKHFMGVNNKSL